MVNYSNTKIYKIWSTQGPKIYIGSTTKEYLSQRMDTHRSDYKRDSNITSKILFEEYGVENCFIELIEAKECKDKHESSQLEGHYIRILECVNKNIAGRTQKQYKEDNKEKMKEHKKEYYINNKEQIKEERKKYYIDNKDKLKQDREDNKEQIKEYYINNKEKKKEYYINNKEQIKEQQKEYYIINKEKIKQQKKEYYLKKKLINNTASTPHQI